MAESSIKLGRRRVEISHPDKVMFPDDGITKADLVDYYARIAETALRHYRGRTLTMHRYPDGIGDDGFYQKEIPSYFPDWFARAEMPKKEGGSITYAVVEEAACLPYLANQGCVTPHLSLSRHDRPDHPDRIIFDLDPSDDDFSKVQEAASDLRQLFDEASVTSFVKTTGSRGLHVLVPLDRSEPFDDARDFALGIAKQLAGMKPDRYTVEMRKKDRGDRIFIDYLRNAFGQTAVAPYAVRALPGAPIATPLHWDEALDDRMTPQRFTIENIFRRLGQTGDPWAGINRHRHDLAAIRRRMGEKTHA